MPRTIESMVASHEACVERRKAGRPNWDATVQLREAMAPFKAEADDLTPERAVEMAHGIALALRLGVPKAWRDGEHENYSMDFEDLFERLEQATTADFTPTKEFPDSACEVMDGWLDELYDWGDRYRVWLG